MEGVDVEGIFNLSIRLNSSSRSHKNGSSLLCWPPTSLGCESTSTSLYSLSMNDTFSSLDDLLVHEKPQKVYWALLLTILPIAAVFGNILVIVSVYREKSLQSVTNYFIVSLAFADLFVASVVMPFAVYFLVSPKRTDSSHGQIMHLMIISTLSLSLSSSSEQICISFCVHAICTCVFLFSCSLYTLVLGLTLSHMHRRPIFSNLRVHRWSLDNTHTHF